MHKGLGSPPGQLGDMRASTRSASRSPGLGKREKLQDAHLTFAIHTLLAPPAHVWVATPAQVVLLLAGHDHWDKQASRDGELRSLWDNEYIRVLILPITSDLQAGCCADAGEHWSVLVVRRRGEKLVTAQLLDSLRSAPVGTIRASQHVLAKLSCTVRWRRAPRRPQMCQFRLQSDGYQCGCYCILLMQHVLAQERGEEFEALQYHNALVTREGAKRLRSKLCEANVGLFAIRSLPGSFACA